MEQKKKEGSKAPKSPLTRAEHLRQKGISLPPRVEGKRAGAAISPHRGGAKE